MKNKKILKSLLVVILIGVCCTYLYSKGTYTLFESKIDGHINPDIANWNIKVNDQVITTSEVSTIDISNITWLGEHVIDNKVAPGSIGSLEINIDPVDTDVAIRYDLEIVDKHIDPLKILTINSVVGDGFDLVKTGPSTYTGIITLDDIKNVNIKTIKIDVEWIDDGTEIDFDEEVTNDDYLLIDFKASQYKGETIVPFSE